MTQVFGRIQRALTFVAQNGGPALGGEQSYNAVDLESMATMADNWLRLTTGAVGPTDHNLTVTLIKTLNLIADPKHVLDQPGAFTTSYVAAMAEEARLLDAKFNPPNKAPTKRKYVILHDAHPASYEEAEFAVILDPRVAHATVHRWVRTNDVEHRSGVRTYTKPVAAGFFTVNDDLTVTAFGESESLGIGSRPQDAEIIRALLIGF